jgi:hypothetical protein
MNFSADSRLKYTSAPSVVPEQQRLPEQMFLVPITFEEALAVANHLVLAERHTYLSEAEILVIKGAWNNKEYQELSKNSTYSLNYLQRRVAPPLWDIFSKTIGNGERIVKKNLRYFLEQVTKKYKCKHILDKEQTHPTNNLVQIIGSKLPDVSNFYGREQDLTRLKELVVRQRCVLLVGAAGIGKSALAAKLVEEFSIKPRSTFDCLIWKSVAHAPLIEELITDLIKLIKPLESFSNSPEHSNKAMISVLIKQLQSRPYLLVLDASEALFQRNNLQQQLEYKLFFRRLSEELSDSCVLLTSRIFPDEIESLIAAELPIDFMRVEGLEMNAALQLLSSKGLSDNKKCNKLIKIYRGNPTELKAVVNRIHHFFASSTEKFLENPTTLVSDQLQEMLNQIFSQQLLSETQRQIMVYLADELALSPKPVNFAKLLIDMNNKQKESVSTSELIRALESLEKDSLIESNKNPVTKEISFTLQPVIKKYILTDPKGLVRVSDPSSNLAIAS